MFIVTTSSFKYNVNAMEVVEQTCFAFWNFLEFIFLSISNPWLVESPDAEPVEMNGQVCVCACVRVCMCVSGIAV